jgi:MFS family permease
MFAYIGAWLAFTLAFVNRWVARRVNERHVIAFTLPALAVLIFMHLMPRELWMYYVLLPFLAVSMGLMIPNVTAVMSNLADDKSQGEIIGIQHSMQSLALVIPPIISGFIVGLHVSLPVIMASAFMMFAWGTYMLWFQRAPQKVFHETA